MAKVLIIDDDVQLCATIKGWLSVDHHNVEISNDGDDALNRLRLSEYDLIILDVGMPGKSGLEVLQEFRSRGGATPVLMLTGKNSVDDVERGFETGADDYLTKPFHGRELTARLRALLRRPGSIVGTILTVGDLVLDRENYRVARNGSPIELLPKEFDLLEFFMRNVNRVFTAEALLNRVWTADSEATTDAVTSCIKRLRKKIDVEGKPSMIRTMRGVGYKLEYTP